MQFAGIRFANLACACALIASPAMAELRWHSDTYLCERGVTVPVTTIIGPDDIAMVVLSVDGGQFTLLQEPAASGARYGWPSDGAHYIWHEKAGEGMLFWSEAGTETPVLKNCRAQ